VDEEAWREQGLTDRLSLPEGRSLFVWEDLTQSYDWSALVNTTEIKSEDRCSANAPRPYGAGLELLLQELLPIEASPRPAAVLPRTESLQLRGAASRKGSAAKKAPRRAIGKGGAPSAFLSRVRALHSEHATSLLFRLQHSVCQHRLCRVQYAVHVARAKVHAIQDLVVHAGAVRGGARERGSGAGRRHACQVDCEHAQPLVQRQRLKAAEESCGGAGGARAPAVGHCWRRGDERAGAGAGAPHGARERGLCDGELEAVAHVHGRGGERLGRRRPRQPARQEGAALRSAGLSLPTALVDLAGNASASSCQHINTHTSLTPACAQAKREPAATPSLPSHAPGLKNGNSLEHVYAAMPPPANGLAPATSGGAHDVSYLRRHGSLGPAHSSHAAAKLGAHNIQALWNSPDGPARAQSSALSGGPHSGGGSASGAAGGPAMYRGQQNLWLQRTKELHMLWMKQLHRSNNINTELDGMRTYFSDLPSVAMCYPPGGDARGGGGNGSNGGGGAGGMFSSAAMPQHSAGSGGGPPAAGAPPLSQPAASSMGFHGNGMLRHGDPAPAPMAHNGMQPASPPPRMLSATGGAPPWPGAPSSGKASLHNGPISAQDLATGAREREPSGRLPEREAPPPVADDDGDKCALFPSSVKVTKQCVGMSLSLTLSPA
jgi:hypothetical protein